MFPAPSPNSQALYASLASGGATPSTLDFHRTAMSAAAAKANRDQAQPATSQPQDLTNGGPAVKTEAKSASGAFDPHDNDAANGLFMLAQGAQQRNGSQSTNQQYPVGGNQPVHAHPAPAKQANTVPQVNGKGSSGDATSVRGISEAASGASDDMDSHSRPTTRGKGKRGSAGGSSNNGRRKAEDTPAKPPPSKKVKVAPSLPDEDDHSEEEDDDEEGNDENGNPKSKMTDEEKRKNFLERNRYERPSPHNLIKQCKLMYALVLLLSSVVSVRSSGWPTFKTRLRCSALRTTPLRLRSLS